MRREPELVKQKTHVKPANKLDESESSPHQCLFCHLKFENDSGDLDITLEHMSTVHGLFIPEKTLLSDLGSFLGYLATSIRVWHECLYCGATRTSTSAVQSHMRDSGHCMLNLVREPELMEFWECKDNAEGNITQNKITLRGTGSREVLQLRSGKTTASKRFRLSKFPSKQTRHTRLALRAQLEPLVPSRPLGIHGCHQVDRRDMGIQNVNQQIRNSLFVAAKRSQKAEAVATRAREWTQARKANDQKHDQAYGPLSWAKGGAHNLLPR